MPYGKNKTYFLALKYKRYWQENVTKHKIVAKTTHGKKIERKGADKLFNDK